VRSDAQVPTASSSDVGLTVVRARSNAQIPAASSDDVKVVVDQARAEAPVADPEYKAVDLADRRVTNYELNPRRRLPEARAAAEIPSRAQRPAGTSGASSEAVPTAKGTQRPARLRDRGRTTAAAACLGPARAKGECD
jgi:hypothetical protein